MLLVCCHGVWGWWWTLWDGWCLTGFCVGRHLQHAGCIFSHNYRSYWQIWMSCFSSSQFKRFSVCAAEWKSSENKSITEVTMWQLWTITRLSTGFPLKALWWPQTALLLWFTDVVSTLIPLQLSRKSSDAANMLNRLESTFCCTLILCRVYTSKGCQISSEWEL